MAEISAKDFGRAKYRSGGRGRGRGRGRHSAGRQGPTPSQQAGEEMYGEEEEEEELRADGAEEGHGLSSGPLSRSQGADLASLLTGAQHYYSQAYYRRLSLQQEVEEQAAPTPSLASAVPEQDLVLDLPALADCLAALPLHQLLGVEPQFLQELEQQQPLQQQPQQQQRQQQQQQQQQVASAKASQQAPHLTDRPVHAVPQAVPLPVAPPPIVPSPVSISWPQPSVASTPVLAAQQLPVAGPAQAALLRTPAAAASGTSADAFDSELDSLLQGSSAAAAPAAAATAPAGSASHSAATPAIAASVPGSTPPQVLTPGVSPAPLPVYRPPIGMAPSALSSAAASAKGSGLPAGAAAAGEVDDELEELLGIAMRPTKGASTAPSAAVAKPPVTAAPAARPPAVQSLESWLDDL